MVTLYKRANALQAWVLRVVEGACLNAMHAHPRLDISPRDRRSIAKRAAGTLTAPHGPLELAARKEPSEWPDVAILTASGQTVAAACHGDLDGGVAPMTAPPSILTPTPEPQAMTKPKDSLKLNVNPNHALRFAPEIGDVFRREDNGPLMLIVSDTGPTKGYLTFDTHGQITGVGQGGSATFPRHLYAGRVNEVALPVQWSK